MKNTKETKAHRYDFRHFEIAKGDFPRGVRESNGADHHAMSKFRANICCHSQAAEAFGGSRYPWLGGKRTKDGARDLT